MSILAFSKEIKIPICFDFGPINSKVKQSLIPINENIFYQKSIGYGFVSTVNSSYKSKAIALQNEMTSDRILSNDTISFRVDIAPGSYWLEIFIDGGKFSVWRGEVVANDKQLADELHQYRVSGEGEKPPYYWFFLRKITVRENSIIIHISAKDQSTSLAGMSIYPDYVGPIQLQNGRLVVTQQIQAPNANLAIRSINNGTLFEAQNLIDTIRETQFRFEKANLLLALAGRIEDENPRSCIEWTVRLL